MLSLALTRFLESIDNLRRSLRLVWESSREWTILAVLLVLLQGLMPVITLYLIGRMIDAITTALQLQLPLASSELLGQIALVGIVMFLDIGLGTLAGIVREGQSLSVSNHILSAIHAKSIAVD